MLEWEIGGSGEHLTVRKGPSTREFLAYGERWRVTRLSGVAADTRDEAELSGQQPAGLLFGSVAGELRFLPVPQETSYPTQQEFEEMTEDELVRLVERARLE